MIRPKTVFFDMDGVLVDFFHGAIRAHGLSLPICEATEWDWTPRAGFTGMFDPAFWAPMDGPDYWANLLPHDDGVELFRRVEAAVGKDRVGLLTSAIVVGSGDGKRRWVAKHLPGYERHMVTATAKHLTAAPCKVLLDDSDLNIDGGEGHVGFAQAGGHGVVIPRPWNRQRHLCDRLGRFQVGQVLDELIPLLEAA